MAEKIVIAEKLFVGYSGRSETTYVHENGEQKSVVLNAKLAFATYYEDNAACKKRMATIEGWRDKKYPTETLDNKPATGFQLSKRVTHGGGWNDLNVYWRILDPRGFELEISSGNLAKLFQYCTIDHGVIAEECVWGFDKGNGSKVVLLPVNSEIYIASVKTTETHTAEIIPIKEIQLGDEVELKSGMKGIYCGKPNGVLYNMSEEKPTLEFGTANKHVILCTERLDYNNKIGKVKDLFLFATPNIIKKTPAAKPLSKEETEKLLNASLNDDFRITQAGTSKETINNILFFTFDSVKDLKVSIVKEPINTQEFIDAAKAKFIEVEKRHNGSDTTVFYFGSGYSTGSVAMIADIFNPIKKTTETGFLYYCNAHRSYHSQKSDRSDVVKYWPVTSVNNDTVDFVLNYNFSPNRSRYSYSYQDRDPKIESKCGIDHISNIIKLKIQYEHSYGIQQHEIKTRR